MSESVKSALKWTCLLIALTLLQVLAAPLLSVADVRPDFVLTGLYFLGFRKGPVPASILGFFCGLALDLGAGEVVGISALAKTVTGFAAGQLHDPERTTLYGSLPRFALFGFIIALLHNVLAVMAFFRTVDPEIINLLVAHGIGGAFYSFVFIVAAVLIHSRLEKRIAFQDDI